MKILLVEDNLSLAEGLQQALKREGFVVNHVTSGKQAIHVVETDPPDIILLDLGLPDMDGLDVVTQLRKSKNATQIMLLTARDSLQDKVTGLDQGADDYLAKPFEMPELLARLRVLERRMSTSVSNTISIQDICLETNSLDVSLNDKAIDLSRREYMLLKVLMQNAGRIMTRDSLESQLYSWGDEISSNAVEVHIHHLRKKLPSGFIKTIRGVGYKVDSPKAT